MRIRSKLILLSVIFILGMFSLIGLAIRTWHQMEEVNDYIEQGIELQVKSREVQSLMKDMVFDLFVPRLYGQLRSFTYSPRSVVTIRQWKTSVYEYRETFKRFSQAKDLLEISDTTLIDQFNTAQTMHEKAMGRLEQLDSMVTMIKGQMGQLEDDKRYNEILGEDTFIPFFEEFRDTSYYFANSVESFMNYFIEEFRLYALDIRNGILVIFLLLALGITAFGIISSLLISRDFLWKIHHVESAFRTVSRGDFTTKMDITSRDEFGSLSTQFNTLISDLKENVDNILLLTRDLGSSIRENTSLDELMNIVTRTVVQEKTADGAAIFLHATAIPDLHDLDRTTHDEVRLMAASGSCDVEDPQVIDLLSDVAQKVSRTGRAVNEEPGDRGDTSFMAAPLNAQGILVGALVLMKTGEGSSFTDLGVTRLSTFAQYTGLTLDNHFKYLELIGKGEAEYQALQSQVQPHFIYNILNGFIGLNRLEERDELEKAILELKDMLRYTQDSRSWASLSEEFAFVENYCELQKLRFDDRLRYTLDIEENLRMIRVPRLILQPIVENAIIHGIEPSQGEYGKLTVSAFFSLEETERLVTIVVKDNGVGFDLESLTEREHIGVGNVRKRLQYAYPGAQFTVRSTPGRGTEVRLSFRGEKL
ncbi:MAG: histidine kinase [Sphaerochaetaceae bacterium]|nr:histidine kinase [Sphaerochaetaceae bacterium]